MNHMSMKRISTQESVWSVTYLHSLFECSNSNWPCVFHWPWYLSSITLISWWKHMRCSSLMSPRLAGYSLRWPLRKGTFMLMLQPTAWKLSRNASTISLWFAAFVFPKNPLTIATNAFHTFLSTSVIELDKILHLINFLIYILSKTPAFILS